MLTYLSCQKDAQHLHFMKHPWMIALTIATGQAYGDQFQDVSDSYGITQTLAGVHHATTSNPDGTAISFWSPDSEGSTAATVGLSNPHMAGADADGNIFIADKSGQAVLKLTTDGPIHTLAGTHEGGFNGDGPAPATSLQLSNVNGLFVFPSGTVYVLDPGNHPILRISTDGMMTTIVNDPEPEWYPSGRALWVSSDESHIYYTHEFRPVPPSIITDGAAVKRWTSTDGIETLCGKSVGFRSPGNIDVNPIDGMLYVCDRAEEDATKLSTGLFRIDGPGERTRITGAIDQPTASEGQLAIESFIDGPRGIAFRSDGSYFLCGHRDGNVRFVDPNGILHKYLQGKGTKDGYSLEDGPHPPLTDKASFAQPRAVTLAPNGNFLVVCNDSGYVFQVTNARPATTVTNLTLNLEKPSQVTLRWSGRFGVGYRLERSISLTSGSWESIGAVGGRAVGPTQYVDPEPTTHSQHFYRILPSF
jgi:hypothetical protein